MTLARTKYFSGTKYQKYVTCGKCSYENYITIQKGYSLAQHLERGFEVCAECGEDLEPGSE